MTEIVLDQPHHVTVGYVGVPGDRTFYVQAEDEHQRISLLLEKTQVAGIGDLLAQLLARLDDEPASDWDRDAMALRDPVDPRWRVGDIQVGLDPDQGRFVIELTELTPEDEEGDTLRFSIDQDQARRLAAHADEVVGQGRPRCRLCGRPMEPDGTHVCPSTNGHGTLSR
jgi:uncharacterized repeat protein (TIGR03847 family)